MHIPTLKPDYEHVYKQVIAETTCRHPTTAVRKRFASNGAISIWNQCQKCGYAVGPAIRKATMTAQAVDTLPTWDDEIAKRFSKDRETYQQQMNEAERVRCVREWRRHYDVYLETPEWKRKRDLVMARAQEICEGCREAKAVDVHHLTYDDAGEEFLFQLVALCRKCHERWHSVVQTQHPATSQQPPIPPTPQKPV